MHFIIYETVNLSNGKKYRGAHICESLNDSYLGSGKLLKLAIAKYGFDNFRRTILMECDSIESMFEHEALFVNKEWVEDPNTYNLKIGGEGGWDYINKNGLKWTEEKKKLHSIEMKKKRQEGKWGPKSPTKGFANKKHSLESKERISKNNAMVLSDIEVSARLEQWRTLPNERGKITKISEMWGISHTQVRRFLKKQGVVQ